MLVRIVLAVAALAWFSPALVQAQSQPYRAVQEQRRWSLDIGAGPVYGFSANGGNARETNLTPWFSFNYGNRLYGSGLDGLAYNAVNADDLRVGGQLRPRYESGKAAGGTLERPGFGIDATLYAFKRLPGNVVIGGRFQHDLSDVANRGNQLFASVGQQTVTRIGLLQSVGYVRAGDANIVRAYYGITPEDSALSGMPEFRPGGGVQNAGVALLWMAPLGAHYGAGAFINYERILGDATDSPLVTDETVRRAGLIFVRRFGGD